MSTVWVWEASAVLSYMWAEEGYARAKAILQGARRGDRAVLSSVTLSEVLYRVGQRLGEQAFLDAVYHLELLPLHVEPFAVAHARSGALLRAQYRLSIGDAAVVAVAHELVGRVVTRDPDFLAVEPAVAVEWIAERPAKR